MLSNIILITVSLLCFVAAFKVLFEIQNIRKNSIETEGVIIGTQAVTGIEKKLVFSNCKIFYSE